MKSGQIKKKYCVITYDLFAWIPNLGKKCLYEVKLCFNVSIEAQVRQINQQIINPSKMLASVKLMYVLPWIKLAIIYPL